MRRRGGLSSGSLRGDGGGGTGSRAEVAQRLVGVLDPLLGIGAFGRVGQEGAQVLRRAAGGAALQQEKREAVMRAGQERVERHRAPEVPVAFARAARAAGGAP